MGLEQICRIYNQKNMTRNSTKTRLSLIKDEAAKALMTATYEFLRRNNISNETIADYRKFDRQSRNSNNSNAKLYRKLLRAYRDVAILMSTWYANPIFLDKSGQPVELSVSTGRRSVANLIRKSRVRVPKYLALEIMRRSPSIKSNSDGTLVALRRVLVLPEFEVPRAALVVERYLDTIRRNMSGRRNGTTLLLERNCFVSDIDLTKIAPTLRNIKERGAALMDGVDGEIESCRSRRYKRKGAGELGVMIFAWTRSDHTGRRRLKS